MIQDNSANTDQYIILNGASMHNRIVSDGNIIANHQLGTLISAVQHRSILDVCVVADRDGVYISPHNGIEPHGTIIPHRYLAHHDSAISNVTLLPKHRGKTPYRFNDSHRRQTKRITLFFLTIVARKLKYTDKMSRYRF
jgi:hypothetical protein